MTASRAIRARHAIRVRGVVHGVGMRPSVCRLARGEQLAGFVRNDSEGVWIEIEGPLSVVAAFPRLLTDRAPPLARISAIEVSAVEPRGDRGFRVAESEAIGRRTVGIPADAGTCDACARELFDPRDRRHRYAFVNCTDCGPRFTIVREVPYDRASTTMAAFAMCAPCREEYDDPLSRRYHAEPNACPTCGPRARLVVGGAAAGEGDDAISGAARMLARGAVVAVKGLGGYQLAALASDGEAVARLRSAKRRPHKPFAVMVRDLEAAERVVALDSAARTALRSAARPIVLLPVAANGDVAAEVAPGLVEVGVMLPSTPLHLLLLDLVGAPLVMTSGNAADEPIAVDDDAALAGLSGVAAAFLCHDRTIHTRADDSVVRPVDGAVRMVRRARGFVPEPIALACDAPCILAVGGQLKNTVCSTRGREAFLSQHIGDLDTPEAQAFFDETIAKLGRLLDVEPTVIAHDLHPDYASTRWALARGVETLGVQHHHAHLASCLAENATAGEVIGVVFDGTGCGPRGDLWGGEFLVGGLRSFYRAAHLRPIALPGGEAAIREPWRLAVAALHDAGATLDSILRSVRAPPTRVAAVVRLLERRFAAPLATGAGRWFDAVAAIAGVRDVVTYEGQAAIELEALASRAPGADAYPFEITGGGGDDDSGECSVVDLRPTVRAVADEARRGADRHRIAARFHATLASAIVDVCARIRGATTLGTVALSGGCFQNRILSESTRAGLAARGFHVLTHQRVPTNDGGLALGQAAVAAEVLRRR